RRCPYSGYRRRDEETDDQGQPLLQVGEGEDRGEGRDLRGAARPEAAGPQQDEASEAQGVIVIQRGRGVGEKRRRRGKDSTRTVVPPPPPLRLPPSTKGAVHG